MKKVELFVPFSFEKRNIDIERLKEMLGNTPRYVSKGRYAIIHILKSYGIEKGIVGISAYMCPSIKNTLEEYGFDVSYYDVDIEDLNASVKDIERLIDQEKPVALVVASLYGNPADMERIETICRNRSVVLIDDAAQAFGSKLNGRYIGSFGDGGFFSFSPGKPTAAHRGGITGHEARTLIRIHDICFAQ